MTLPLASAVLISLPSRFLPVRTGAGSRLSAGTLDQDPSPAANPLSSLAEVDEHAETPVTMRVVTARTVMSRVLTPVHHLRRCWPDGPWPG